MVWLGGALPLRHLLNLCRLLRHHERAAATQPTSDQPYLPLLWLDRSAWENTVTQAALPVTEAAAQEVPPDWINAWARMSTSAADPRPACRWLRIDDGRALHHVPVLIYEEQRAALARPWRSLEHIEPVLEPLAASPVGRQFLLAEAGMADIGAALRDLDGPQALRCMEILIDHSRTQWARHGLLCLASDLLRLLVLVWRPGAYADLGDVGGQLSALPSPSLLPPQTQAFCGHHTVAIENDLIFAHSAPHIQAIAWGSAWWGARTIAGVAARLGLDQAEHSAAERLVAVLPELDRRLPAVPDLRDIFAPPGTRLADYIALAYGSQPAWGYGDALRGYFAGRRDKEMLIDHIGGFTGYQKFAYHLAPGNATAWHQCAQRLGLSDYAPQLGWKSYGFGTMDRLIGLSRLLDADDTAEPARRELAHMAASLGMSADHLEALARHACRLHDLLARAHFAPAERAGLMAQVQVLCGSGYQRAGD